MDLDHAKREFNERMHLYTQLRDEALFIIEPAIRNAQIKIHSVANRVKTVDSFLGKIQRKQLEKPFETIRDIVGIRVICLFLSDIGRIGQIIRNSFTVLDEDDKVQGAEVSSFGYMSLHFTVTMKDSHSGPRYDFISKLPFEIQVRTIAMDAWANVSHYLDYKTDKDVPSDLRRDFYALSGLFYVADRHFEMFFLSRQESQEKLVGLFQEPPSNRQFVQEINLDSLSAYLQSKYPDRRHAGAIEISALVEQLIKAEYRTMDDVERSINKGWDAFLQYEADNQTLNYFFDIGAVRATLEIVDNNFIQAGMDIYPEYTVHYEGLEERLEKYRKMLND
jgi:ppGpp synthetase/RelA/SpoT-type nucleotidyltranferase